MANPIITATGSVEGVWLVPSLNGVAQSSLTVWVNAEEHAMEMPGIGTTFSPPSRGSVVVQLSEAKQEQGTISGLFEEGFGQTSWTWLYRFRALHRDQEKYDVQLITPRFKFPTVVLGDGYTINEIAGLEPIFEVSFAYTSVT